MAKSPRKKGTALLTGASSDIGQAISRHLKLADWEVIGPSRRKLDLTDLAAVGAYTEELSRTQQVDAFIHVAGLWHEDEQLLADKMMGELNARHLIDTINVGVISPMLITNCLLAARQLSMVIGVSGTFNQGARGWLPYYVSKRALEDFLVGLSQDQDELQVYGISPADTATKAFKRFYPQYADKAQPPAVLARLVADLLIGRKHYASGTIIEVRGGELAGGFHV